MIVLYLSINHSAAIWMKRRYYSSNKQIDFTKAPKGIPDIKELSFDARNTQHVAISEG